MNNTREVHNENITTIHQLLHRCTAMGCDELAISPVSFVIIATRMWLEELSALDAKETSKLLAALSRYYDPEFAELTDEELNDEVQEAIKALFDRYDFLVADVKGHG